MYLKQEMLRLSVNVYSLYRSSTANEWRLKCQVMQALCQKGRPKSCTRGCCSCVLHHADLTLLSSTSGHMKDLASHCVSNYFFLCTIAMKCLNKAFYIARAVKLSRAWAPPSNWKIVCVSSTASQAEGERKQMKQLFRSWTSVLLFWIYPSGQGWL